MDWETWDERKRKAQLERDRAETLLVLSAVALAVLCALACAI